MRKILLSILLLVSLHSMAQQDSSQLQITLTLKVKFIAFMAYQMSIANSIPDTHLRDTLIHYLGSGTQPDSQIVTHFKTGFLIKWIQQTFNLPSGVTYTTLNELANGTTTPATYIGLGVQIGTISAGAGPEKKIGQYLGVQLAAVLGTGTAVMNGFISTGTTWLQTPVTYN